MRLKEHFLVYRGLPKGIYFLFLSDIINRMGGFILPLMTLILTGKLGLSVSDAGLFATAAMLAQAPFFLLGGKLSDKFGSKRVIVLFDFLGAFTYLLCGFLPPGHVTAVLLVVASAFFGVASPAHTAIIPELAPPSMIKSAYSLIYLGYNIGLSVGPLLGGLLFVNHFRLLFLLDGMTTMAATIVVLLGVRSRAKEKKGPFSAAAEAILEEEKKRAEDGSVFSFLRKNPVLLAFAGCLLIYNFCYIQWAFILPLQTVDRFGENGARLYSLLVSVNAVTVVVLTPLLTSLTRRLHALETIFLGGVFYLGAFLLFAVNGWTLVFMIGMVSITVGEILININMNVFIAQKTPDAYMGRANSLLSIVNGAGFAIGPVIMGNLLLLLTFRSAWFLVSGLIILGFLLVRALRHMDGDASSGGSRGNGAGDMQIDDEIQDEAESELFREEETTR
ncbi:MFS transporter [Papillibacter cinnamivorans]|uniref:Predicted arabinose efflux permease, MFS family n=1 Tax=Papillibacter cinnamivorans DSM 12816 TaxID=1122930 RepID=A0A1W2C9W2_9FIRM|nr:MFS transporter [Papillibacter cinnamivorans]SMC81911.1 Predicted arabinose efflux permease, MFS family [Papillibacter cinnamivorans DSM 12816]